MPLYAPIDSHHHHAPYSSASHPSYHHHSPPAPTTTLSTSPSSPPHFFFRRRTGKLSWSLLSSVSLSSIISTVNVDLLQDHVDLITYADINETDLAQATDAQIIHLIRLAQLTIEYLLNVQNFLLRQHRHLQRAQQQTQAQLEAARKAGEEKEQLVERLTAENKFLKKLNKHIQAAAPASPVKGGGVQAGGGAGMGMVGGAEVMGVHTCEYCRASFVNEVYLAGHIGRRHPDKAHTSAHARQRKTRPPPSSSDSTPPLSPRHRRKRREEEKEMERLRSDLQRQRDELDADRRRLHADRAALLAPPPSPPPPPPPPLAPAPTESAVMSKEWLEQYTKDLERRVREETIATLRAQPPPPDVSDQLARLSHRLDEVARGEGGGGGGGGKGVEEVMAATKEELLREIKALKEAQAQAPPSPMPVTPLPPPSPASSGGGRGGVGMRMEEYQMRRFASFSEFPSLLSRFEHEEGELVRRARGVSEAVEGVGVVEGEGEGWLRGVEERGYEEEEREVREEVDRLMEGFVDPTLEQRWHDVVERERHITQQKKERADRERERHAEAQRMQAAQAQAHAQAQAQVHAQAHTHPAPAPTMTFLQPYSPPHAHHAQPPQQVVNLSPQPLGYPQLPPLPQPQSLTHLLQTPPTVPSHAPPQPAAAQHLPPPSPFTTDVDGLLRRQQDQANLVDELRRKLHPDATVPFTTPSPLLSTLPSSSPSDEKEDVQPFSSPDPTPLHPLSHPPASRRDAVMSGQRPLVPLAQQGMSDEEEEEEEEGDVSMPPPPTMHHTLPPPQMGGRGVGDDEVEAIDLDQPLTPAVGVEEKEEKREEKPAPQLAKLSPIKRVGGGYTMKASQRGPALPALTRTSQPAAAADVSPPAAFTRPTAGFFNDSQELELEEEEF